MNVLDITGTRIGKLIAVCRTERPSSSKTGAYWLCRCDCGTELVMRNGSFIKGHRTECDLCKYSGEHHSNLVGKVFGRLTVLRFSHKDKRYNRYWLCSCSCGKIKTAREDFLVRGTTVSCGCEQHERLINNISNLVAAQKPKIKQDPRITILNRIYNTYRSNAKTKGREFSISKELLSTLLQQPCTYCGRIGQSSFTYGDFTLLYNGIDRVDSSRGYVKDNVTTCCSRCNRGKLDLSVEEFKNWIEIVYDHMHRGNNDEGKNK
jgi:hypothetical protein